MDGIFVVYGPNSPLLFQRTGMNVTLSPAPPPHLHLHQTQRGRARSSPHSIARAGVDLSLVMRATGSELSPLPPLSDSRILSWPWIPSPAPPRARLKLVTAAADAAIPKPAAADWLDPAHNSDDGTCGEERNRYPRSTKETASSLSLATVYSVRFPFY